MSSVSLSPRFTSRRLPVGSLSNYDRVETMTLLHKAPVAVNDGPANRVTRSSSDNPMAAMPFARIEGTVE